MADIRVDTRPAGSCSSSSGRNLSSSFGWTLDVIMCLAVGGRTPVRGSFTVMKRDRARSRLHRLLPELKLWHNQPEMCRRQSLIVYMRAVIDFCPSLAGCSQCRKGHIAFWDALGQPGTAGTRIGWGDQWGCSRS